MAKRVLWFFFGFVDRGSILESNGGANCIRAHLNDTRREQLPIGKVQERERERRCNVLNMRLLIGEQSFPQSGMTYVLAPCFFFFVAASSNRNNWIRRGWMLESLQWSVKWHTWVWVDTALIDTGPFPFPL